MEIKELKKTFINDCREAIQNFDKMMKAIKEDNDELIIYHKDKYREIKKRLNKIEKIYEENSTETKLPE